MVILFTSLKKKIKVSIICSVLFTLTFGNQQNENLKNFLSIDNIQLYLNDSLAKKTLNNFSSKV